jgi:hypothetical protein
MKIDPLICPIQTSLVCKLRNFIRSSVLFAPAWDLLVDLGTDKFGTTIMFLNDMFLAFPAFSNYHIEHGSQASPLAINVVSCPLACHKSTLCDVLLALNKALAEGTPFKQLQVLGLDIDTCQLLISLPHDKLIAGLEI